MQDVLQSSIQVHLLPIQALGQGYSKLPDKASRRCHLVILDPKPALKSHMVDVSRFRAQPQTVVARDVSRMEL